MASRYSSFNFLLVCLFFLLMLNMVQVEGTKYCKQYSEKWSGWCGDSKKCNSTCKRDEDAHSGTCHFDFPGMACFCYFRCGA
ncbi:defensin-like protein 19 isoform X2 [Amaranthus tricolor]|uniref:defensin-like protein 19 isoform X2 n=1 Tax=Amaranthus tricolor TaxID=29722 RepID=UPI0025846F5C|nr:defensin-like protein 19 isoform X2 [Amaranthus tricolor]